MPLWFVDYIDLKRGNLITNNLLEQLGFSKMQKEAE